MKHVITFTQHLNMSIFNHGVEQQRSATIVGIRIRFHRKEPTFKGDQTLPAPASLRPKHPPRTQVNTGDGDGSFCHLHLQRIHQWRWLTYDIPT